MANYYSSTLQKGSKGDEVKKWQQFLNTQGYNLTVDGDFGDNTYNATVAYQKANGLGADGIVGKNTWGKAGYTNYSTISTPTDKPNTDTTSWDDTSKGQAALKDYNSSKDVVNNYSDFTYDDYVMGNDAQGAKDALDAHNANKPGAYQSQWQSQLDALMGQIMNRDKFSYDLNGDALYQQYKDKYIQQGKMAMADTMGQAAAMTGGYGSSYAQSVGQQAYQGQLDNLNDIVPELYQMALDKYNREGQELYNQYGLVMDRENTDYGRYRDTVSDWSNDRSYLQGAYNDERNFDYGKYVDDRNLDYTLHQDEYQRLLDSLGIAQSDYYNGADMYHTEQANKNNEAWKQAEWDEAARQYANEEAWRQKEWDLTNEQWDWQKSQASASGTGGNGGNKGTTPSGVNYDNGSVDKEDIKAMQEALGIDADGYWGPNSTKAAGGLTADEAYEAWINGELGATKPPKNNWTTNDQSKVEENQKEFGGSYYTTVYSDLKTLKSNGRSYSEAVAYIKELLDSSLITQSEYMTLVQKARNIWE